MNNPLEPEDQEFIDKARDWTLSGDERRHHKTGMAIGTARNLTRTPPLIQLRVASLDAEIALFNGSI